MMERPDGLYNLSTAAPVVMNRSMTRSESHMGFLGEIFQGFNLGQDAISQLDEILIGIASSLSGVETKSTSSSDTVNNLVNVNTVRLIADDKNSIDWVI
jgi:hypothetical protein